MELDDMLITLDSGLTQPLYMQIRDQIRERILSGALRVGDRLEPSRELARQLGVHRTTVGNAYADLGAEGLIEGTVGRGTFVSPLADALKNSRRDAARARDDFFWNSFLARDDRDDSLGRLIASAFEPGVISFACNHGAEEPRSVDLVRRATDAVFRREGATLLQYSSSAGYPPLKRFLQSTMQLDGISVELDEILITNGCQQSLDLLRQCIMSPEDTVAVENPTYPGLWNILVSSGIRVVGIPVGEQGIDLEFLAAVLERKKIKLMMLNPSFQNPTGRTMPLEARKRLLELAGRYQTPIVEDDIYGALRYRGRAVPSLKALDRAGLVIYLNSFSKIGFPGLRVGWIAASRRAIERLRSAKQRADLHTNVLGQAVIEELGRRGWLNKLLRLTRRTFERKLGIVRAGISRRFPSDVRWVDPEGGMSVWVELPAGCDAHDVMVKARERGVVFAPSRYFYFQDVRHNAFRLCFTSVSDEEIERGVTVLGALLREEIGRNGKSRRQSPSAAGVALV